jgi:hypothetical protein
MRGATIEGMQGRKELFQSAGGNCVGTGTARQEAAKARRLFLCLICLLNFLCLSFLRQQQGLLGLEQHSNEVVHERRGARPVDDTMIGGER